MASPIWKDYIVSLGAASASQGVPFYIQSTDLDEVIYRGVAYPRPGESTASVRINDVIADFIYSIDPALNNTALLMNFDVYRDSGSTPEYKAGESFWNDWSYNPDYAPWDSGMNFPVVRTFVPGQYIMLSDPPGSVTVYDCDVYLEDGTHTTMPMEYPDDAGLFTDKNTEFLWETQFFASTRFLVAPAGAVKIAVNTGLGTTEYLRSGSCPRYVLYYRNAYGGWDSMPVEGKADMADALERHTTERGCNNFRTSARGKTNFVNEIRRTFQFHTGWLTEAQAALMHHLLNSTAVYLHDIATESVHSIVLTGNRTEYKSGRPGLFDYTIDAELAQERIRR